MQEVVGSIPISSTSNSNSLKDLERGRTLDTKRRFSLTFPTYPRRAHSSGQARIEVHGRAIYLGLHGSRASWLKYAQIKAAYEAGAENPGIPLDDLVGRFMDEFVQKRYRNSPELAIYAAAMKHLSARHAQTPAAAFTPQMFESFRSSLARADLAATTVNHYSRRVLSLFRWAARHGFVPPTVPYMLDSSPPMREDEARQTSQVEGVDGSVVQAAMLHMPPKVRDMVALQRMTGMRPGEVRNMKASEVDTASRVWVYSPRQHKTAHKNKRRFVAIPAAAKEILEPYLVRRAETSDYIFRSAMGLPFTRDRYRQVIDAACRKAGVPRFSPNQLRHAFAAEADKALGRLGASKLLGHAKPDTTALYVEHDLREAVRLMEQLEAT